MEFQGFPKISRYSRECIITEKIDGSNAQIYILPNPDILNHGSLSVGEALTYSREHELWMFVGSRSRYITPENDNHGFAKWVKNNAEELFKLGPGKHYGEWWGQGINRGYGLKEKRFSLFNLTKWSDDAIRPGCCYVVPTITRGILGELDLNNILHNLEIYGSYAAPGFMKPEGIVIYHIQGNILFKKTIEHDEQPKGVQNESL